MRAAAAGSRHPARPVAHHRGDDRRRNSRSRALGVPASAFLLLGIACAPAVTPAHAAAQDDPARASTLAVDPEPTDFVDAKAIADADEASMDAAARAAMQAQLRAFLDAGIGQCATERTSRQLDDFVVVMRLDADGRVDRTWRRGSSPLALCVERHARGKTAFVPPRAPFHCSLEVSFVP